MGIIENLVGHKSHQHTEYMQICLREPADISSSGHNVQAYFIYLLSHYAMLRGESGKQVAW